MYVFLISLYLGSYLHLNAPNQDLSFVYICCKLHEQDKKHCRLSMANVAPVPKMFKSTLFGHTLYIKLQRKILSVMLMTISFVY